MAESKIEFSYGNFHFACKGDTKWVEYQLNQMFIRFPELTGSGLFNRSDKGKPSPENDVSKESLTKKSLATAGNERQKHKQVSGLTGSADVDEYNRDPLFGFLRDKNADKNQVKKFLATAVYLHSQGMEKFSAPMISKSLDTAKLGKLINASDCLNKNEKKGFCIKDDKEFILTEAGIRSIIGGSEE